MHIEWTGKHTQDSEDIFTHVYQAMADRASVSVYISQEAMDDGGLMTCQAIAERKIRAEAVEGKPPKRVNVTTADLAR